MSKELIVSVNGREKRIAIIEDDRVSEFYIERGEENQGIVGNIYKGRVMRVLPGMQSAFVDIDLERDAFLYVSDFFDEEEEFERIVIDKSKSGDQAAAARAASEHIEKSRLEREHRIEAAHAATEPLHEADALPAVAESERVPRDEAGVTEPSGEDRGGRRRRRDRGRRSKPGMDREPGRSHLETETDDAMSPFILPDSSFERVIDEDDASADTGEMFKDARLQERIFDQIHAVEFDMEPVSTAEVGSFLAGATRGDFSFERVDDGEFGGQAMPVARIDSPVEAHIDSFLEVDLDSTLPAVEFERVSDDDSTEQPDAEEAQPAKRGSKKPVSKSRDTKKKPLKTAAKKSAKKSGAKSKDAAASSESDDDVTGYEDAEACVSTGDSRAEFATTRRGGRRRRRTKPGGSPESGNGHDAGVEDSAEPSNGGHQAVPPPPPPPPPPTPTSTHAPQPHARRPQRRGERHQAAITDLLREGQEILVQIAKEPIAKKGARITSHIALPGRCLVYMPTVEHVGVSRKIESDSERLRLRKLIQAIRNEEDVPSGGFIVRTAGIGRSEQELREDARYLVRTWLDIRKSAEKAKAPSLVHRDLDLVQRILRDQLSDDFTAIRVDSEEEYLGIVEFVNRIHPRMVKRVKLYTRETPILEEFGVQQEIDKAIKPRVWLKSGGYLVINQTEALVSIDVNTGKFVGRGGNRLEDTITKTNLEAVDEIVRQIRLRDLGGIIVLDLIDMEDRRNRNRVMQALQEALQHDKSPTKVLSFNDFGLVIMTRKRVKQSLERVLCAPCGYCQGAGLIKSPQTVCYEILEQARRLSREMADDGVKQATLRVNPEVSRALRSSERDVLGEIEDYLGAIDITSDERIHQENFDFALV